MVSIISSFKFLVSACNLFVSASQNRFSVHHKEYYDDEHHKMVQLSPLQHAPLEKEADFQLSQEDPKYYKNEVGYNPVKEWEEPLPTPPSTSSSDTTPQFNIDPAKIRKCQQIHDMQVEVLEAFGVDACRAYEQNKVENVIEAVQVADKECPLCKKPLKGGGAVIKSHIRAKHMDSTPFVCSECNKSFGNNQLLQEHKKTHKAKKFPCTSQGCKLSFLTQGRLNSHLQTHDAKNLVKCQFCPKTFNAKKNLALHEKTCANNPAGKVKDKQCPYCPKAYYHQKDLKYHLTKSCTSQAGHKDS